MVGSCARTEDARREDRHKGSERARTVWGLTTDLGPSTCAETSQRHKPGPT
jgi:hypothetical protein